jgi:hypothetical protein
LIGTWLATRDDRRACALVVLAGAFYAIPLLLADRPYVDDLGRALYGQGSWTSAGRPLADLVMIILNFGTPIADLAPLTQLLAIAAICMSCMILYKWSEGLRIPPVLRAAACTLFLYNPFLLENLSYRYDSLTQALSVLVALLAVSFPAERPLRAAGFGAVLTFLSLCLYQVAVNISIGAAILLLVLSAERAEALASILRAVAIRFVAIAVGLAVYMLVAAPLSKSGFYSPYAERHAGLISLDLEGLGIAVANFRQAFDQIWRSFDAAQRAASIIPTGLAIGYCFILAGKTIGGPGSPWQRVLVAALILLAPLLLVVSVFGVQLALEHPVFYPRIYLGFGLLLVFVILFGLRGAVEAADLVPKRVARAISAALMALVLVPPAIPVITVGFAYGAAEAAQRDYEMLAANEVRRGLAVIGAEHPRIVINGTIDYAPPILPALKRYPILKDLVVRSLDNDWYWGPRLLLYYGASIDTNKPDRKAVLAAASTMPPDYVGAGLTLTQVEDVVVIGFDK